MPAAAIIPAVATIGAGAMMASSASEAADVQSQAVQQQGQLAQPQIDYMERVLPLQAGFAEEVMPLYTQLAQSTIPGSQQLSELLAPLVSGRLEAGQLRPDVSQAIGERYGAAGTRLGQYFSGKGTLQSGQMDQQMRLLEQARASEETAAIMSERDKAINEALSLLGRTPIQQPSAALAGIPGVSTTGGTGMDFSSLGSLMANIPWGATTPSASTVSNVGSMGGAVAAGASGITAPIYYGK